MDNDAETSDRTSPAAACGHPTQTGGPCRNQPVGGPNARCFRHSGIPSTAAERAASQQNATKHGYFVSGFLDDDERARFEEFLAGGVEPEKLRERMIVALILRAERMMRWEGSGERGEKVSGYTTDTFAELRQAIDKVKPNEPAKADAGADLELLHRVEALLKSDRDLLLRQLPLEVQPVARAAWAELDRATHAANGSPADAGVA